MRAILRGVLCLFFGISSAVLAQDAVLKPFVLGSKGPGEVAQAVEVAKTKLTQNGFTIAGSYSPYPNATVIAVTNDEMRSTAAKSEHGGFGAAQRVSVTKVGNDVQVAYTNPIYMANAYRMAGDLKETAAKLQAALGKVEDFGAKGLTASQLRKYHYTFGMEYFDEPNEFVKYASYEEAVKAVEAGLAAGKQGVTKVVPRRCRRQEGDAVRRRHEGRGRSRQEHGRQVHHERDRLQGHQSTAHLPYDILVSDNKVYALYARFRIAISFPDLSMMGANSFMNIMKSPEAIREALALTSGGKKDAR
ncbi:MAG: hypothetical protein M5R42_18490 [Rhodocyclaceae bacterium]|nr:hypothetical protein [Rhodocyclaceae bacterium]